MAHRALALKYRPQVFGDLVGQDHVSTVLMRAVESGRVAQAYLFTGARGVGKTTSARILAKALNCERRASGKQKTADPCNECTSCIEITNGSSLDVAEIDGASNRGIADVQALREKVRFSPTGGRYRVVIIDEVHQLSGDAFAALLKTLEEPPAHLVFIFATTDPQKLPDTIRSRTQRFDFARVALRKVAERLQQIATRERQDPEGVKFTLSEGAALLLAQKSEGSMRDAVSALDQVVSAGESQVDEALVRRVLGLADREAFFTLAAAVTQRDPKAALAALHDAFGKGLDPRDLAEGLAEHIRHLLVLQVDPAAEDLVPMSHDDIARLRAQAEGWSEHDLLRLLRLASEVQWPMRDSPQPLVHLEAAVLQMATLEPGETLAQLLARLEALEQRLAGGAPAPAAPRGGGAAAPSPPRAISPMGAPAPVTRGGGATGGRGPAPGAPRASAGETPRAIAPVGAPRAADGGVPVTAIRPEPTPRAATGSDAASRSDAGPRAATVTDVATATAMLPVGMPGLATAAVADDEPSAATVEHGAMWLTLVTRVNERKPLLGAFLGECTFVGVSDDALVLSMDEVHRMVVDDKDNHAIVLAEMTPVFGRTLALRCVGAGTGGAETTRPARDLKPAIERAVAFFEGEIIERPRRDERKTS
ncbi:MAG: DNA polymerase III subunit gamma/tau [Candidatus Eisenbacteria bacterium]